MPIGGGRSKLIRNRVLEAFKEQRVAFGVYLATGSPHVIELLAFAGLDYVRIDLEGSFPNPETIRHLIHTAHAVGITPFVRVPKPMDAQFVGQIINMGALGIIIPRVDEPAEAEAAVRAVKGHPLGDRKVRPDNILGGYGAIDRDKLVLWENENVLLAVQVETRAGIESVNQIASVPGVDMLISGRNDLSISYGVPGRQFDPIVIEAEGRMVDAGIKAGKITSVTYFPLRGDDQLERIRIRMEQGVHCVAFGGDNDLMYAYQRAIDELR